MAHKPARFVRNAQHSVQLVGAHCGLGRAHEVSCQEPFVQRYLGTLIDRPYSHRELLAAGIALIDALTVRLALQLRSFVYRTTMWTFWTIGPAGLFKVRAGFVFILENGIADNHGLYPISILAAAF